MPVFQYLAPLFLALLLAPAWGQDQTVSSPVTLHDTLREGDRFMDIQLLGSVVLENHPALTELSALAWDEDEQLLYALSDHGHLVHLKPVINEQRLVRVDLLDSHPLLNRKGKPLSRSWRDSEGLTLEQNENRVRGDTRLIISFERQHRIERYTPDGQWLDTLSLPSRLRDEKYAPRGNRSLEAVTRHPLFGLMTGPEQPPDGIAHYLAADGERYWTFTTGELEGALVALESLPNGDLLLLERAYTSIFSPWVITLSRIPLSELQSGKSEVESQTVARMDSSEGWLIQNMEGLTRHQGMSFFMVSDDGNKPWAQTQLFYFRVIDPE